MYIRVVDVLGNGDMYYLSHQDLECIAMDLDIDDDNVEDWYDSINKNNCLEKITRNLFDKYKQWKGCVYPGDKLFYKEIEEEEEF